MAETQEIKFGLGLFDNVVTQSNVIHQLAHLIRKSKTCSKWTHISNVYCQPLYLLILVAITPSVDVTTSQLLMEENS